jgi:hypothetical protein
LIISYNFYVLNKEVNSKIIPEIQRLTVETWNNESDIRVMERRVCGKA